LSRALRRQRRHFRLHPQQELFHPLKQLSHVMKTKLT
jgi:hypothetical protein